MVPQQDFLQSITCCGIFGVVLRVSFESSESFLFLSNRLMPFSLLRPINIYLIILHIFLLYNVLHLPQWFPNYIRSGVSTGYFLFVSLLVSLVSVRSSNRWGCVKTIILIFMSKIIHGTMKTDSSVCPAHQRRDVRAEKAIWNDTIVMIFQPFRGSFHFINQHCDKDYTAGTRKFPHQLSRSYKEINGRPYFIRRCSKQSLGL